MNSEDLRRQLYSRQEYVVGAETQAKYGGADVLVVGSCGLAAEIIKNLALTGVRSIKVTDDALVTLPDLSTNFFLTPEDVNRPRAEVVASRAQELNRFVSVAAIRLPLHEAMAAVHVVVFVNQCTTLLHRENKLAREHNVKFVACESRGVAGCVFVDPGPSFTVLDPDGEETLTCVVTKITRDGVVELHEDKRHECEIGSRVFLTGLVSPAALNSTVDPFALHNGRISSACANNGASGAGFSSSVRLFEVSEIVSPFHLRLKDFSTIVGDSPIDTGYACYLHTTKRQLQMDFKELEVSVTEPDFVTLFDSERKMEAPATLHAVFRALHSYMTRQETPKVMKDVLDVAETYFNNRKNDGHGTFDREAAEAVLSVIHGRLNPMDCFIGGVASQEALKVCSGKFTPLRQWMYYDAREILLARGEVNEDLRATSTAIGSRYDGQIAVLGSRFQSFLSRQRAFVVGAGALGCELIKNVACMGFGGVSITDMDTIEMSNLSRQFLFRSSHIGQQKSKVAGEAARAINNDLNVNSYMEKVAQETEGVFNEKFWESHSVVLSALDNVESRKYVDARCLLFKKPLFDSGTLGQKCHAQCVVPYCSESYGGSYDPPEKSIPLCTLKNFPNTIEHTIQWARDNFDAIFVNAPNDVNAYLEDPTTFAANLQRDPGTKPIVLKAVQDALLQWPSDAADCVRIAVNLFNEYFNTSFRQLLHNIPLDKRTENAELFWSGAKKPPKPQEFNADSELDISFVYHCAKLLARIYNLPLFDLSPREVAELARRVPLKEFVPREPCIATIDSEKQEGTTVHLAAELSLQDLPPACQFNSRRMSPQSFEKDDPNNSHMDYITSCSNLRATAYSIPPADVHHTRRIAGKIIPAMVTTTALITGLVGIEMLKYLLLAHRNSTELSLAKATPLSEEAQREHLGIYRNSFVNVALPFLAFTEPIVAPAKTHKLPDGGSVRWGIWDRIEVNEGRDVTVQELVDLLESRYQLEIFIIALPSGKIIYSQFGNPKDRSREVAVVARERDNSMGDGLSCYCLVATGSIGDEDVDIPLIHYRFRDF